MKRALRQPTTNRYEEYGEELFRLAKELLELTGRLLWLMAKLLIRWLVLASRFVYRYRLQILDYKYTPAVVLLLCTVWFIGSPKKKTAEPPQPEVYFLRPVADKPLPTMAPNPALLAEYRDLTSSFPDKKTNLRLSHSIYGWLGVPHCDGGNTRKGTDCSGFVQAVFREVYRVPLSRSAAEMYTNDVAAINRRKLREGDLVFFNIGGEHVSHVGIFLKDGRFAHASTTQGVMVNSLDEPYYQKYFYRAGRVKTTAL